MKCKLIYYTLAFFMSAIGYAQNFPNPVTLSTGQGAIGALDPIWTCSEWFVTQPGSPVGATFQPALINNNCAPGSWVDPAALTPPMNNANWITGNEANCATNSSAGYRFFRLTLDLPPDCNGFSVTQPGNYTLNFLGYVDNTITDVFLNNTSLGISGGGFSTGSQLSITINGPWQVGTNYIDILVYNVPSADPTGNNPYGLLLVADATSANGNDTDGDGISDAFDDCMCDPGNNPNGCVDPTFTCDIDQIRTEFANAGCIELEGCWNDCSMYFLNTQSMTGSQAQSFAQTLGANLVSIQSLAENQCLLDDLVRLNQTGVIWIGFNDEATEGSFVWYDQSTVTYTNWAPGEPNQSGDEDCVQIYPTGANPGQWNDLSCTSANSQSIIEVNLCPFIDAGIDVTICESDTVTLSASTTLFGSSPYTYEWESVATTQSVDVWPTQTTSYVALTEDRYGCSASDTVVVTVNMLPDVIAPADETLCPGDSIQLLATGADTYVWNNGAVNGSYILPASSTNTYTVTGTDSNGCMDADTVEVNVMLEGCPDFPNDYECDIDSIRSAFTAAGCTELVNCVSPCSMYFLNPQSMTGSQAQSFAQTLGANLVSVQSQEENDCILSSLISLGFTSNQDVIWIGLSDEVTEGDFVWYDQSPVTYTNWAAGEPNQSGDEDCVQIYTNGTWNDLSCSSNNAKSIIEVNLCPVTSVTPPIGICEGETATIGVTSTILGSSPYSYQWSNGSQQQQQTVQPVATTEYIVSVLDRYSCHISDTTTVTVNPNPEADFTFDAGCLNDPVSFQNNSTIEDDSPLTSDWDFGSGLTSNQTDPQVVFPVAGEHTVTLVVYSEENCSDSIEKTVVVYDYPDIPSVFSNSPVACPEEEFVFSAEYVEGATYYWEGPNGFTSNSAENTLIATEEKEGDYTLYIEVNDCPSQWTAVSLTILGQFTPLIEEFPNVITPNNDGKNDYLDMNDYFTSCLPFEIEIVNRWGNLVWKQDQAGEAFSGNDMFSGAELAEGVYFYRLKYGSESKSGFITIIRK